MPRQNHRSPLAFEDRGQGDPIVLIHGFGTSRLVWLGVAPLLERTRRVVAVDVPGFGGSPPVGPGFALEAVADRICYGLAQAGIPEPYDLVGHSLGGAIALTMAARRPASVRRLVLVAPAGFQPAPSIGGEQISGLALRIVAIPAAAALALRRAAAPLADLSWGRRALHAFAVSDPARLGATQARLLAGASRGATRIRPALLAAAQADLRPELLSAQAPVGVIWGDQDRVLASRVLATIRALRPDVLSVSIERAGHVVMAERPEEFVLALEGLLARMNRGTRSDRVGAP